MNFLKCSEGSGKVFLGAFNRSGGGAVEPLISVIIPAYNVEKYLERCLNSVIRQTYRNIEILLIDDGSTDQTSAICDRYADLDGRITVLHKDNSGQADCRNIAFQASSGEMICYVDSDDFIAEDYLEYLYLLLMKYGGDISMCGYRKFSDKRAIGAEGSDDGSHVQTMTGEGALESLLYQREVMTSPWAKLFHKKFWRGFYFRWAGCMRTLEWYIRLWSERRKLYMAVRRNTIIISGKEALCRNDLNKERWTVYILQKKSAAPQ